MHDHAVVLGASIAGLLAARVLADHYAEVTIVERDELPDGPAARRGVPHGRHLHGLHPRGRQILDELFPGFSSDLVAAGAVTGDLLGEARWLLSGHRLAQAPSGLRGTFCSRPLLESHVRARVRALPPVRFLDGCAITGLTVDTAGRAVTGARVRPGRGPERTLPADLVVDATGRGSRTPAWLEELGYPRPPEERVVVDVGYATRTFRFAGDPLGGDKLVLHAGTPAAPRMGAFAPLEDGRWIVSLGGILGDHPPTDLAGFTAFAASLTFADIADALRDAEPADDGVTFRFPANTRRRYERLPVHPERLLVTGDALCSFNPIYGQGMAVAAMQAAQLRRMLAAGPVPDPAAWYRAVTPVVDVPWQIAVGADLVYPGVGGPRTAQVRMVNTYLPRLHAAAVRDPAVGTAFLRVMGLLDPPESLLRPGMALRVLTRRRPAAARPPLEGALR